MADEQILSYAANAEWKCDVYSVLGTWAARWPFTEMVPRGEEQRAPLLGVIRERRVRSGGQHCTVCRVWRASGQSCSWRLMLAAVIWSGGIEIREDILCVSPLFYTMDRILDS
jgi:hypothetical protein